MLPLARRWFDRRRVDDSITLLWEPHVVELMRCNIWHVRGSEADLIVDTGMGVSSLAAELADLIDKPVIAVATHGHADHIGSHHEFTDVAAHPAEADALEHPELQTLDVATAWGQDSLDLFQSLGMVGPNGLFIDALPAGFQLDRFTQRGSATVRRIDEGDAIDLGDRHFEVLHLPGHSPGSIGLWEKATGTLFSGDAVYDGLLLDELPGSNIATYCQTMERLMELPVSVVHGGHDPSFDRDRLRAIARDYLERRSSK